ncbi:serine hydrolase domain-containing protein [Abyssalbus ytuae]|uniref:Beta-lactamase family protein n=1 Tax=Abyssalbus ytuae TaxID=2926907 RepID=A0A9E6ZNV6_9FLAO|nr:serine hydrolase domain-containing protein [Abyssalbus ytuae]UOB18154.1 beta-lactamase family protein [Abyssalbus ytuae]
MKKLSYIFMLIIFIACKNQTENNLEVQNPKSVYDQTDAYVTQMMDSLGIIGLNYTILLNNKVVHQNTFGYANLDLQVPMKPDNLFPVASISKLFSSTALNKLLKIKNRSVDETVGEILPERTDLPSTWRKLTIKQLLSHTSGMPDQIDYQIFLNPENDEAVIEALKNKLFVFEPNDSTRYCATGFLLVRLIFEKLSGQPFDTYMQENYFDKFNLKSAEYGGFKKTIPNRVTSYRNVDGQLELFPLGYSPSMYAAAGLNINMADLTKWIQAVLNEQIMNKKELSVIWDPVILNNGEPGFFGLGWETYELKNNIWMTGHGGAGISSIRHYWKVDSDNTVTVILLTNGARNWSKTPDDINMTIANYFMQGITD